MSERRFRRVLIANRGEIAVRIVRACQALGYESVAVYSDADAGAPHVRLADRAIRLGPAPAAESYLAAERILEAASRAGADAVHPGYGFLAENAQFAAACAWAGLRFIGPGPEAIELMGDKARAKERMRAAGVPVVPGAEGDPAALRAAAGEVGYPLLVKAAGGGGGRGMRRVAGPAELEEALAQAAREAEAAFGSDRLLIERLVEGARHVEVQVLADSQGTVLHLGERDCSAQRRYQKVIEEAPSPAVDAELRARMGAAAVEAARAIAYEGAGTVELLLGPDGAFYFLEMNTRLQVEHPVTEEVTGIDIVGWQLRVAAGEPLAFSQEAVRLEGHAIEARLYAEDPAAGHLPQTGRVIAWEPPVGPGLRCDHGMVPGLQVGAHYDPMLAKLIAHGRDRDEARRRLRRALDELVVLGLRTNRRFLRDVLDHPVFAAGQATTDWLEREEQLLAAPPLQAEELALAGALLAEGPPGTRGGEPADAWRSAHPQAIPIDLRVDGEDHALQVIPTGPGSYAWLRAEGEPLSVRLLDRAGARRRVELDGVQCTVHAAWDGKTLELRLPAGEARRCSEAAAHAAAEEEATGTLRAPSSGVVHEVLVAVGQEVAAGQPALRLESMKIETTLRCAVAGVVREVRARAGDQVERDAVLVVVETDEAAAEG